MSFPPLDEGMEQSRSPAGVIVFKQASLGGQGGERGPGDGPVYLSTWF